MPRIKPFTPEQISAIENMSAYRMPMEQIAVILNVSKHTLERRAKRDKKLKEALERGRARGSAKVYQVAFQMATGYKREREVWDEENSKLKRIYEDVPPDINALKFWLKTQEKWRETDRLELTGKDGEPLSVTTLPAADRKKEIARIEGLRKHLAVVAAANEIIDVTPAEPEGKSEAEEKA